MISSAGRSQSGWSDQLEELHEESSRTHFIDRWTRQAMISQLGDLPADSMLVDVGCSTGYLLEDLASAFPNSRRIGVDLVFSGLRKASTIDPRGVFGRADARRLPLRSELAAGVVSANLLEHIDDDLGALAEIFRVLAPGGRAVIVVPLSPGTFDYYDRFLLHVRRYARGELARKARAVGFTVIDQFPIGFPLFPAFWAVKKYHRFRFELLDGADLDARVAQDIASTKDSRIGAAACSLERGLVRIGFRAPFGIRGLTTLERPEATDR